MKPFVTLISACCALAVSFAVVAEEVKSVEFGTAEVVYEYLPAGENVATLSLNAVVSETNDSLRGLKNSDQRRLGKLGQLIYQCKLLLFQPEKSAARADAEAPMLISRNYSLYTGVNLSLSAGERLGIKVRALQPVDDQSLFTSTLGGGEIQQEIWQNVGDGSAIDLRQLNVNILKENDVIGSAENIDIILRFPIFQLEKPVRQWVYNFDLRDFRQAVRHADENCTPDRLTYLIDKNS